MKRSQPYRIVLTGGGTGGHVFPAIAIAIHFRERHPTSEILFVGAKGKMEMHQVTEAGFNIVGLTIRGLQRSLSLANLVLPFKFFVSLFHAHQLLAKFKPDVVVGTGGYVSGPVMLVASWKGIPSLIQEQNSYAGLTNKQLAKRAEKICVAYSHMDTYFPKEKIVYTGNPIRKDLFDMADKKWEGLTYFSFKKDKKNLLILGGSLGARTINECVLKGLDKLIQAHLQVIWQTGKTYYHEIKSILAERNMEGIQVYDFVQRIDLAYSVSDVVIARSGALTISELCMVAKAVVLVPSPNVAEDHQKKNAQALVDQQAAIMIEDHQASDILIDEALRLLKNEDEIDQLSENIYQLAKPNATQDIVKEAEKLIPCS